MTPERYRKLKRTLDRRQPDLTLLTEQIHKPRNIAALVRTSDAVGIQTIHMVWPWEQHKDYSGTAMGSDRWVDIERHDSMVAAIDTLKADGYRIYAAHLSDNSSDYRDIDYTVPCAILMGNEKKGVSAAALPHVDCQITIPMEGMVESFNVSVAAAIILAEAHQQRLNAGLYDAPRMSTQTYREIFFRWAHPEIAVFCAKHDLSYPPVSDEDGEIIDAALWYAHARELIERKTGEPVSGTKIATTGARK